MSTIGTNIGSITSTYYLTRYTESVSRNIQRLASGSRLSTPMDDAAGVAVSAKLSARDPRLRSIVESTQNMISFAQTADGFLNTIQRQLTRMSELAQRATNGAFGQTDRDNYNIEFDRLKTQIMSITANATFNGNTIFTTGTVSVAVTAEGAMDNFYSTSLGNLTTLGLAAVTIGSTNAAVTAIATLNLAIQSIARRRAEVNADISKFQFHIQNVRTEKVNVEAANGRIKDLDVATESTDMSKNNILEQASSAMLSQANTTQQSILSLLR